MELGLERAVERFGDFLHFDGNQAGARTLVDIVITHDLAVTYTDDQLNAQIQLKRTQNGRDRGHSITTSEQEQTAAQKRSAGASGSTPEGKAAVQPDGQVASQQTGEVFVDCGAARFNFDKKNEQNYFVLTITPQGEQRTYWGRARLGSPGPRRSNAPNIVEKTTPNNLETHRHTAVTETPYYRHNPSDVFF